MMDDSGLLALWNGSDFRNVPLNWSMTVLDQETCTKKYQVDTTTNEVLCPAEWDDFYCWPPTTNGSVIKVACTDIFTFFDDEFGGDVEQGHAFRECGPNGQWLWGNWTNYNACMDLIPPLGENFSPITVSYIIFIGSIISFITLIISLFIFSYFKSLQCSRIRVHKNLVLSLMLHSTIMLLISLPGMFDSVVHTYQNADWLCKALIILKIYSSMTCIYWMFVEGHLLHSSITVSVFGNETPFIVYHLIGWGIPLVFVSAWTTSMASLLETRCWRGYGKSHFIWLVTGPMIIALIVNTIFLVNIIRILITKLKRSASLEMKQVKKAMKATALLFPLLGITHLLFCINPRDDAILEQAYMITNAVLQSSQGLFVALLYCFFNSEVQSVLISAYMRSSLRRHPERSFGRSRVLGSMTNTTALSQSYEQVNGSAKLKASPMGTSATNMDSEKHILFEKETCL